MKTAYATIQHRPNKRWCLHSHVSIFLALNILFSCFWATSLAAFDLDWSVLEPGEMFFHQEGLTTQKSPTIYFVAFGNMPDFFSIRFTLVDSRSMRPVAEVPLHSQIHPGLRLQRIQLGEYGIELEQHVDYQWYVSEIPNPDFPMTEEITKERIKMTEGDIVRITSKHPELYEHSCEKDNVRGLADSGMWYDAFACVNELIEANPQDRTLRYLRSAFLGKCRDPYDGMPLGPCFLKYGASPRRLPRNRP